jgi:hypothetical protein
MKKILSLLLSLTIGFLGLVSVGVGPARAQTLASVTPLSKLREQYERLLAVEHDPSTSPEVREVNHTILEERRAQLAEALHKRIDALRVYRTSLVTTLTAEEKTAVEGSIQQLVDELQSLQPPRDTPPAEDARPSRRPLKATQTKQVIQQASFSGDAEKSDDSATVKSVEPTPAPAARPAAKSAAIDITSPDSDKTVHVGEIEMEVNINDQDVDDIMVAVYTPASTKPISARTLELKRSDKGAKSFVVSLSKGDNRIEVSDLKRSDVKVERNITFQPADSPGIGARAQASADDTSTQNVKNVLTNDVKVKVLQDESQEYDWGRVRGYFSGGVVFSKERESFSKSDIFLSFVLDKNYLRRRFWNINTFFEARLTAVPVAAQATPTPTPASSSARTNAAAATGDQSSEIDTFIASRKAAMAQVGIYIPVNVSHWHHDGQLNSLFIAPLAKGGISTITGDTQTAEALRVGKDDVYNFFSIGARFGHYSYPKPARPCDAKINPQKYQEIPGNETKKSKDAWDYDYARDCDEPWDYAPELISWLDLTMGRWENFEVLLPTNLKDSAGNVVTVRRRPWRYQAEGRLKIPGTPFIAGFDGNFGEGPDDVRFGFGMRFDVGNLIQKFKALQDFKALGEAKKAADEIQADPTKKP